MTRTATRPLFVIILLGALTVGCARSNVQPAPSPAPQPAPPQPAQPVPDKNAPQQVPMVWGTGWSVTVRPVFSGVSLETGDGTIAIESWDNGPAKIGYDFPAFTSTAARPEVVASSEGLLRAKPAKGVVTVDASSTHQAVFTPPTFWPGGDSKAPGPLIWMPPEVTTALRTSKEATISLAALPNGLRMQTRPAQGKGQVTLTFVAKGDVVLPINGMKTRLPALRLKDDQGGTYTVLDSAQNPLVVRYRFGSSPIVDGRQLSGAGGSGYDVVALERPK